MDPRLVRSVEIPERRCRPLFAITTIALLFASGSYAYVQTTRGAIADGRTAILTFNTEPPGAAVAEAGDDRVLCVTPCDLEVRAGVDDFRLIAPGFQPMHVLVSSLAGDVRIDATLVPAR